MVRILSANNQFQPQAMNAFSLLASMKHFQYGWHGREALIS